MTTVQDGDTDIALYTCTSDEAIKVDLDAGQGGSFILQERHRQRRPNPTHETDHIDLASGALSYHRDSKGYTQSDSFLVQVESIPKGLELYAVGGHVDEGYTRFAVSVYEERK